MVRPRFSPHPWLSCRNINAESPQINNYSVSVFAGKFLRVRQSLAESQNLLGLEYYGLLMNELQSESKQQDEGRPRLSRGSAAVEIRAAKLDIW